MPTEKSTEVGRVVRHIAVPLVAFAAAKGWIAYEGSHELSTLIELGAIGTTFIGVYMWSWWKERGLREEVQDVKEELEETKE